MFAGIMFPSMLFITGFASEHPVKDSTPNDVAYTAAAGLANAIAGVLCEAGSQTCSSQSDNVESYLQADLSHERVEVVESDTLEVNTDETAVPKTPTEKLHALLGIEEMYSAAVGKLRAMATEVFNMVDINGDDEVTLEEAKVKFVAHAQDIFKYYDTDRDGIIKLDEVVKVISHTALKGSEKAAMEVAAPSLGDDALTPSKFKEDFDAIRNGDLIVGSGDIMDNDEQQPDSDVAEALLTRSGSSISAASSRRRKTWDTDGSVDPLACGPGDTKCKNLQKLGNRAAWKGALQMFKLLTENDYCWRDAYDRGAGKGRICKSGYSQGGLLCYEDCPSGYKRGADHCWKACKKDWAEMGPVCCKSSWFLVDVQCYDRATKYKPGQTLTSSASKCPSNAPDADSGLCYPSPKTDYSCTATSCNSNCKGTMGVNCGVGACAASDESCKHNIVTMIEGSIMAVIDTAILVASFGSSASLKVAASATQKAALKQAATQNMKRVAIRVSQREFKDTYKQLARKAALKAVKEAVKTKAKDHAINKGVELTVAVAESELASAMVSAADMAEVAAEELIKKMSDENKEFDVVQLDFTGILKVVDAMENDAAPDVKAAAWLGMLSTFDPTGVLAAAANFAKPHCSSIHDKIAAEEVTTAKPEPPAPPPPFSNSMDTTVTHKNLNLDMSFGGGMR